MDEEKKSEEAVGPDAEKTDSKETRIDVNHADKESVTQAEPVDLTATEETEKKTAQEETTEPTSEETEKAAAEGAKESEAEDSEQPADEAEADAATTDAETDGSIDAEEKKAGPDGPYRPELTKTVEEAIEESEQTQSDAFKPDPEVDKAVDEIVRTESDEALAEVDAKLAAAAASKDKETFRQKMRRYVSAWWNNRPARYGTFAGLFVLFTLLTLLPTTRYGILNIFGVRVSSSMMIVDSQTRLPLRDISVSLQNQTAVSDQEGNVSFTDLKLGSSDLAITKRGYADDVRTITLGWGSNPLGEQGLVATGEQFTFVLSDWQSGASISNAEATAGENSAVADDEGKIILTVGEEDIANVEVTISAEGYRDEMLSGTSLVDGDIAVAMVPGKKHAFVSNRNGNYDLYVIDVDTQNEELLVAATGRERDVPTLLTHPTRNIAALVSSRDGEENRDGFVMDGLFIVNLDDGELTKVTRSEQLRLVGWSGDKLVYWQVVEGTSAGNPERSKLISYNQTTGERTDLAAANYFNDVELVGDTTYYAVSSFAVPQSQAKLYSINTSGDNKELLVDSQVWSIFRRNYNELLFSAVDQKWYSQTDGGAVQETEAQNTAQTRRFVDSPNGERTAWVDIRDGKGVLLMSSTTDFSEEQVLSLPGLNQALYWLNDDTLVFRVISNSETADYVINLTKGEALKITDVTATQRSFF